VSFEPLLPDTQENDRQGTTLTARIPGQRTAAHRREPRVSVIVPTFNEAENLPYVFERMPLDVYEVIVVDGNSTDGTVEQAEYLWPGVRIVKQSRSGKGNALACGFRAAGGDIVVTVDADGSADPGEIPRFVAALVAGADYAKGTRFGDGGGTVDITPIRRLGNRVLNGLVNALYDVAHTDLCYGYNAIWRRHVDVFGLDPDAPAPPGGGRLWGDGFEIETLMTLRALQAKLTVAEVPSFERPRLHGASNLNAATDGLRVLRTIGRAVAEDRRARHAEQVAHDLAAATPSHWTPISVSEVELSRPLPHLRRSPAGATRARVLVRLHGHPLGESELHLPPDGLTPASLGHALWAQHVDAIRTHLAADGLPAPTGVPAAGLQAGVTEPRCQTEIRRVRAEGPHVSVVIATRDRTASLLRTLRDLEDQDYPRFDVLVVDSAPSDHATARALHDLDWTGPELRYLRVPEPGLAIAHNAALPHVRGSWVAFTDDDVEVDSGWLTALAAGALTRPDAGCVTGLLLPAELETYPQALLEQFGGYSRGFTARTWSIHDETMDVLFPYTAGRFGSGANMAYQVDALRAVGGFDAAIGAGTLARGGDDLLGFLRVLRAGLALAYRPDAIVRHHHHRDVDALYRQIAGYGVGLGAYMTAAVAAEPAIVPDLLRRTVPAVRHLISRSSPKNRAKLVTFPSVLTTAERRGLLAGPLAYARSRRAQHLHRTDVASEVETIAPASVAGSGIR
jgi:glycosyltransferase involved in cell wall biosynthesis